MQRINQSHGISLAITRRPIDIISSERAVLSVSGRSLWKKLSEELTHRRPILLLDGRIMLLVDSIVRTELGAVGLAQEIILQPPVLCVLNDELLLDVSRPPDLSDLRIRGVQCVEDIEQKVKEYLQEPQMSTAHRYLRSLEKDRIDLALFGTSNSTKQVSLISSDDYVRFVTTNLVFETSLNHDLIFDETSSLFRDRTIGLLVNELGSFILRGKDTEAVNC